MSELEPQLCQNIIENLNERVNIYRATRVDKYNFFKFIYFITDSSIINKKFLKINEFAI